MDPAVARRTQESLGKVIRKPPLTDKLLAKPPFRYLHDILTEVIRTTGFFKGLYTESELKSEKDKEAKISFLQKAVDVVALVTGEPLAVKPARVVAGHEPEKTNEFLQAIGKCCLSKLSSDDAVKRILSGEKVDLKGKPPSSSKSQDKENREAKEEERRSHKEKEDKREPEIRERSGSQDRKDRQGKEEEKKEREKRKERERNGEPERDGLREGEKNEKEKNKVRESRSETDKERSKEKSEREKGRERERRSEGSHGKQKDRTREKARERDRDPERNLDKEKDLEHRNRDRDSDHGERSRDREHEKSRTRDRDKERKRERDPERERRKERGRETDHKIERDEVPQDQERTEDKHKGSEESTRKTSEVSSGKEKLITEKEKPPVQSKNSRPSASKLRERRPAKPTGEGETASDEEGGTTELHNSESHNIAETNLAAQRKIPRPGSARPAPPRVRRQASAEVVVPERVSSGKGVTNVIVDKQKDNGDDDDNEFVVEEASPQLSEMPKMELEPELDLSQDEKHGGLVKKILETKKDYETQKDAISKDKLLLTDNGKKKEKDLVTKEIEKLRGSIQILCRSALPLGKMMDYIQEDMDTMKNELQMWRTENRQHAEVLLQEQSVTDTAVDPLKAELAELEQLIREQRDKICTVKGNIMRNEEKIQKMVQSIATSGRD